MSELPALGLRRMVSRRYFEKSGMLKTSSFEVPSGGGVLRLRSGVGLTRLENGAQIVAIAAAPITHPAFHGKNSA